MAGNQGASYLQASLPALPAHLQSDTQLTAHLASRYHVNLPTARLSSRGFISINTYTTAQKGPDGGKEGSASGEAEELAGRALSRLAARGENQAIVFLGESGSGKTTIRSTLLSSLLAVSSTPLSTKISLSAFIFDTLTTTKSNTAPQASKAGLFLELQYDASSTTSPILLGGKIIDHRLERSRIASVPTGERSFHVLYYLLAGTSQAEKRHLGLDAPSIVTEQRTAGNRDSVSIGQRRWRYLGHPTQLKVGINDAEGFQHFKTALRKLEFTKLDIADICQVLACILHLGQLEFIKSQATTPAADESGGYSHEGGEDITKVKNEDTLAIVAAFLGLNAKDLEASLGYRTKTISKERVTIMLDAAGARTNADELARTLYALIVAYIVEHCNQRTCANEDSISNTIAMVDFPGFQQSAATGSVLDQLLTNSASEAMYNFAIQGLFENKVEQLDSEEINIIATSYFDNTDAVKGLLKPGNGLLSILDDQTKRGRTDDQFLDSVRKRFQDNNSAITASATTIIQPGSNFQTRNMAASFTIKHYAGEVDYPIEGLIEANNSVVSGDMMNLINSTKSEFVAKLFGSDALKTTMHPQEKTAVMQAQVSSKPLRMPSTARRGVKRTNRLAAKIASKDETREASRSVSPTERKDNSISKLDHGASGQYLSSLDIIRKSVLNINTNAYFVFCLKPNDRRIANQFDSKCVRSQLQQFGIAEISQRLRSADFSLFLPFPEFLGLAAPDNVIAGSEREKAEVVLESLKWPENEARAGTTGVFLSERCWSSISNASDRPLLRSDIAKRGPFDSDEDLVTPGLGANPFNDSKAELLGTRSPMQGGKRDGYFNGKEIDTRSDAASAFHGDMFRNHETREEMAAKGNAKDLVEVEDVFTSGSRKRWLAIVWLLTFYIPNFAIRFGDKFKRADIRTAWREKLAINILIWLSCGVVVFFLLIFPNLLCPKQFVFSSEELQSHDGMGNHNAYIAIRGGVYDLAKFMPNHYPSIVPQRTLRNYAGQDATDLFPVQVSALCRAKGDEPINPAVTIDPNPVNITGIAAVISGDDPNVNYHDFRAFTNDSRPYWFTEQMRNLNKNYKVGNVAYSSSWVSTLAGRTATANTRIINNKIYDLTKYINGAARLKPLPNNEASTGVGAQFMDDSIVSLFSSPNIDVTQDWNRLQLDSVDRSVQLMCLNNLFFTSVVDTRNSVKCQFANYLLLAVTILLVSVIGFKFLAALQFGKKNVPENLDKFIICQIPAYTEDEEALRRAIDSAARMKYDDKRKLLVVICDGMIIGQGNDRPTPRIVLDILGVSEHNDPEPLSFESLGEGMKQHNMGKVYSGLYEVQGHIVPFLVIVKIGKPSEVARPGNRGKRDSQMLLMRFLNRVHYNMAMNPLELEMHHQIRNVIGVNPTFYEFLFQIDADTIVADDSAIRMVSAFVNDSKLIGLCGETALTNSKASLVTMIQVYEYYISHNLTKAFESLFGSVTCLPGCFSMYRIRAAETNKPLFVSREVVDAYATIRVDTLHMKNLLHLGEDRYLTTLLMKFHPKYKTKYTNHAHAWTIAPDSWKVFLSQRRRWINSTVHNLIELIPLTQLCGFCCFSMRFVVFVDLLSTVVQPVTVFYIGWLVAQVALQTTLIPMTAFLLIAAIYGLQAIIFIMRRKWEMIGWMLLYIIAMPVFSFALPLYSFWYMDDFSWGNTRVVTGEKGRKFVVTDEGKFDPESIPRKKWEDYQSELMEASSQYIHDDAKSETSGISYGTRHFAGYESRPISRMTLQQQQQQPMIFNESRYSLAGSEMLPRGHNDNVELADFGGLPSDDAILAEIRMILSTANLMTVTKKSIKLELERAFGVNLDARRAYIGSATEAVLSGQL